MIMSLDIIYILYKKH